MRTGTGFSKYVLMSSDLYFAHGDRTDPTVLEHTGLNSKRQKSGLVLVYSSGCLARSVKNTFGKTRYNVFCFFFGGGVLCAVIYQMNLTNRLADLQHWKGSIL